MKNKKFLPLFVLASISAIAATGCGNKIDDSASTLQIFCVNAGYKTKWCHSMVDAFKEEKWVKEKYPDLKIVLQESDDQHYGRTRLDAGKSSNTIDLFFDMCLDDYNGKDDLLDLTEVVYNQKVPGEEVLFKNKVSPSYYEAFKFDGQSDPSKKNHMFFAPWAGGMTGILYNENLYKECGYEVPLTTDQLVSICEDYKKKDANNYCFIQGNDENYFAYLFDVLWSQYQSIAGYLNFWNGIDDGTISKNIFLQQGRMETLKVFERLLKFEYGYINPSSISQNFSVAQQMFLRGQSLMNVNGDWFVSETKEIKEKIIAQYPECDYTIKMMKTPIISSIINVVPDKSIQDDNELASLIKAIDAHQTSLTGTGYEVTQDDYNYIKEARSIIYSIGAGHQACIPSYSTAKDVAVDFIRFMGSDKAQEVYIIATDGASLPFDYNLKEKNPELYKNIDILHKERLEYFADTFINPYTLKNKGLFPLYKYGGVDTFKLPNGYDFFVQMSKEKDPKTPQKYWDDTLTYWTLDKWNEAVERAGL